MTFDDSMSPTLSAAIEKAAKEQDPQALRQLVLEVDILLTVIEKRVAEIDAYSVPLSN